MTPALKIAIIYGSTREGRFCDTVVNWLTAELRGSAPFVIDVIDPLHLGLPERHEAEDGPAVRAYLERVAAADGFIVVTPEYNHSFPAALKFLIDTAYEEWRAKPVGFVSYGGISGGLRAVEQLRLVFAELHAVGLRDCVSFAAAWEQFDKTGALKSPEQARKSLAVLVQQLKWWGEALRSARSVRDLAVAG